MMTDVYPRENFFFTNMLPASVAASAPPDRRYGCKRGRQRATGPAGSVLVKETVPRGDIISQKAQYRRSTDWAFSARLATTGSCSRCRRCTLEPPSPATYRRHLLCRRAGGEGLAALRDGEVVSGGGLRRAIQQAEAGGIRRRYTANLSGVPVELRGAPGALPDPARGYAGGRLKFTELLGALVLGDRRARRSWSSACRRSCADL